MSCPGLNNSLFEQTMQSDVVKRERLGESSRIRSIGGTRGNALLLGAALWISLAGPELTPCSLFLQLSWLVTWQNMNPLSSAKVKYGMGYVGIGLGNAFLQDGCKQKYIALLFCPGCSQSSRMTGS